MTLDHKRVGSPEPSRQEIAGWLKQPPVWFSRERDRQGRQASQKPEKVIVACPGCSFTIRVRPATARQVRDRDGLYCGRRACSYEPPPAPPGLITERTSAESATPTPA